MGRHAGAGLMSPIFKWIFLLYALSACKGNKPMSEVISPSRAVDSILVKVKESYSFKPEEVVSFQENPHVYPALLERMKSLDDKLQVKCLERFDELGAPVIGHPEDGTPYLAPYIANLVLIKYLVDFLGDGNRHAREAAARQIFENVPDIYIRNHVKEVIENLVSFPQTSRAAQILAKTGSEQALSIIRSNRIIREQGELWTVQALAKLGDSLKEDHIIRLYKQEKDEGRKRDYAWMLGYVATPKTILTLARDLRNPMTYEWNQTALRSFRVHVIQGLSRAYPMESVLWKPNGTPMDDRYYEAIEEWASSKLGVTWDVPRPPFLYEMDVPTPAQGR